MENGQNVFHTLNRAPARMSARAHYQKDIGRGPLSLAPGQQGGQLGLPVGRPATDGREHDHRSLADQGSPEGRGLPRWGPAPALW